jgi:mRNA interferase RelE/StbE
MSWKIDLTDRAHRDLDKLDPQTTRCIYQFLYRRLAELTNPRSVGEALRGSEFGEYWKYRVGDYRLICMIKDEHLLVIVLRVGHRREVYR